VRTVNEDSHTTKGYNTMVATGEVSHPTQVWVYVACVLCAACNCVLGLCQSCRIRPVCELGGGMGPPAAGSFLHQGCLLGEQMRQGFKTRQAALHILIRCSAGGHGLGKPPCFTKFVL
jgi:hypothetical protein